MRDRDRPTRNRFRIPEFLRDRQYGNSVIPTVTDSDARPGHAVSLGATTIDIRQAGNIPRCSPFRRHLPQAGRQGGACEQYPGTAAVKAAHANSTLTQPAPRAARGRDDPVSPPPGHRQAPRVTARHLDPPFECSSPTRSAHLASHARQHSPPILHQPSALPQPRNPTRHTSADGILSPPPDRGPVRIRQPRGATSPCLESQPPHPEPTTSLGTAVTAAHKGVIGRQEGADHLVVPAPLPNDAGQSPRRLA